jgi:hypothetical protein
MVVSPKKQASAAVVSALSDDAHSPEGQYHEFALSYTHSEKAPDYAASDA